MSKPTAEDMLGSFARRAQLRHTTALERMGEHYVNRYALVLGHGGLGGTGYEIHARVEDLETLAHQLLGRIGEYRTGGTPLQRIMEEEGFPLRAEDPVPIFNEYITLSQKRTDRTTLSFHIAPSLEAHHQMLREPVGAGSIGLALAKVLWFVVLPLVGVSACFMALLRQL